MHANLVHSAVAEAHGGEGGELGFQPLLVVLPLDLLSHLPGLLDGLHHSILVPEQRGGVQTGEDVCTAKHTQEFIDT